MKTRISIFFFFLLTASGLARASLREALYNDIQDGKLDDLNLIEAAWIISGINEDSLQRNLDWYHNIIRDIQEIGFIDLFNKTESAEKLFYYLHTHYLKAYEEKATTLVDIKNSKKFNCVSGTVLYNLICDDLGLATEAFETPTHVYTIFVNFTENVMVENTSSMGFNIMKNLNAYSRYLAAFYPESQALQIGLDRLWAYEQSQGRKINNTELLGLICYNQAFFARKAGNYDMAFDYVLLAQLFNGDSRSNRRFEVNLYYEWGKKLFDNGEFYQAFEVFADGYYRYRDNDNFRKNCLVTFFRTLDTAWQKKDWPISSTVITEIMELEMLSEEEMQRAKGILLEWIHYHYYHQEKAGVLAAIELIKDHFEMDAVIEKWEERARVME